MAILTSRRERPVLDAAALALRRRWRQLLWSYGRLFLFWLGTLWLMELTLHLTVYRELRLRILASVPFDLSISAALALLSSLFRRERAARLSRYILLAVLFVLYSLQLLYYRVFDMLFTFSSVSLGGAAGGSLSALPQALATSWLQLLLFALPFPLLLWLHRRALLPATETRQRGLLLLLGIGVLVFHLLGMLPVWISGETGALRNAYYDPYGTVTRQCGYFGLPTAERLELRRLLRGDAGLAGDLIDPGVTEADQTPPRMDPLALPDRNIMPELDFAGLDLLTEDKTTTWLNAFCGGRSGSLRHEYTGMFKGYNLIEVCAGSFSPYLVDPELTPALYRLTHEGFIFQNFYCSSQDMGSDGLYSLSTGLLPDPDQASFERSKDNYLPFCLGPRFRALGLEPKAYDDDLAAHYDRAGVYRNIGYDLPAAGPSLDMASASDLALIEETVDDYLYGEQFIVHYTTSSGSSSYNFVDNEICIKNRARVEGLDLPEELKAYYACQLELEDAMAYLLDRLQQAGLAERTVIVLTGDHCPSLSAASYEILAGDAVEEDPFWRWRNAFVCWNGGMTEPVEVGAYCCTQDILPTILDLFGVPYESRLLTGMDVLAGGTHLAILQDGSFLSDTMTYDAATGTIDWRGTSKGGEYARRLFRTVENESTVSASILRGDYYRFVFVSLGLAEPEIDTT